MTPAPEKNAAKRIFLTRRDEGGEEVMEKPYHRVAGSAISWYDLRADKLF